MSKATIALLGVPDPTEGRRIYSTTLWQRMRAMRHISRYRLLGIEEQEYMLRQIGGAIAAGDVAARGLRERGAHDALRSVIRQRDYWVEVAYRIIDGVPAKQPIANEIRTSLRQGA